MKLFINNGKMDIYLSDAEAKELCWPGAGEDTCSWLLLGPKGWECSYFNKPDVLVRRRENGLMVAMRDGCEKVKNFIPPDVTDEYFITNMEGSVN